MPLMLHGFSVYVSCEGKELDQYDVQVEGKTTSCHIASKAGNNFEIRFQKHIDQFTVAYSLYIDGRICDEVIVRRTNIEYCSAGVYISANAYRPFQFSSLVTDDEAIADPSAFNPDLGSIKVELRRVSNIQKPSTENQVLRAIGPALGPIHESSKKAGAHCTTLGLEEITTSTQRTVSCDCLDDDPYAIYVFRYRSRDFLRAQGIIPPSLSPKPTSGSSSSTARVTSSRKRPSDSNSVAGPSSLSKRLCKSMLSSDKNIKPNIDLSSDEDIKSESDVDSDDDFVALEELLKRVQQKIKKKKANARNASRIKREALPIRARFTPGEVIDLT